MGMSFLFSRSELSSGKKIYKKYCAMCHGNNGEGHKADHANALNNQKFFGACQL